MGYRVKSIQGTRFRQWATERLHEYIVKGFTMDDERLKKMGGGSYWKELLDRIRDIRSSEKVLYRQVLDIYATSVDYDPRTDASKLFFKIVQNKLHYAAHGHTAAEVIYERADARQIEPTYLKEVAVPSAWSSNWFVGVSGGTSTFVGKPFGISAISFHKMLQVAKKLDAINGWGSVVALTYVASQRTFFGYNDMADAKSMLESIARSFGYIYGREKHVRINTISQSPTATPLTLTTTPPLLNSVTSPSTTSPDSVARRS